MTKHANGQTRSPHPNSTSIHLNPKPFVRGQPSASRRISPASSHAIPGLPIEVKVTADEQCRPTAPQMSEPPATYSVGIPSRKTKTQHGDEINGHFHDAGFPSPNREVAGNPVELSSAFRELLKHVTFLHDEIVGLRVALANERSHSDQQRKHAVVAISNFMEKSANLTKSAEISRRSVEVKHQLDEAWHNWKRSHDAWMSQEERMRALEAKLKTKEARLVNKEGQLYNEIHGIRDSISSSASSEATSSNNGNYLLSAHSGSTNGTGPLAREYYDKLGDTRVFRERLFNFESEHQSQMATRNGQRQLGKPVEPPEDEFLQAYFSQRKNFIQDLSTARAETQRLKALCDREGIPVGESNLSELAATDNLDHSYRVPRAVMMQYATPPNSAPGLLNLENALLIEDIDIKARVGSWWNDVQRAYRADRLRSSSPDSREGHTLAQATKGSTDELSRWTEREAEDMLPFPDYNLLSTAGSSQVTREKDPAAMFQPDPPNRRYSDSTSRVRRSEIKSAIFLEGETSKSEG
jgi:hypothetical protein